jgi:metal-sulfur cluster biosynthetic enzyme
MSEQDLLQWLKPLQDPELNMGLVDLGLIYRCEIQADSQTVKVQMTLTSPSCPAAGYMVDQVKKRILEYPGIKDADVELVFEPKWDPHTMASEEAKEKLGLW